MYAVRCVPRPGYNGAFPLESAYSHGTNCIHRLSAARKVRLILIFESSEAVWYRDSAQ